VGPSTGQKLFLVCHWQITCLSYDRLRCERDHGLLFLTHVNHSHCIAQASSIPLCCGCSLRTHGRGEKLSRPPGRRIRPSYRLGWSIPDFFGTPHTPYTEFRPIMESKVGVGVVYVLTSLPKPKKLKSTPHIKPILQNHFPLLRKHTMISVTWREASSRDAARPYLIREPLLALKSYLSIRLFEHGLNWAGDLSGVLKTPVRPTAKPHGRLFRLRVVPFFSFCSVERSLFLSHFNSLLTKGLGITVLGAGLIEPRFSHRAPPLRASPGHDEGVVAQRKIPTAGTT
jgi:hypothetical protein